MNFNKRFIVLIVTGIFTAFSHAEQIGYNSGNEGSGGTSSISFPNSPVGDVLAYYEKLTGKQIIRDNKLGDINVTIFANDPMTREQAAQFVESALLLNGVALVDAGNNTLKALNTKDNKPSSEVVPLISGSDNIPSSDEVVSYFMPLKYLNPADAMKIFTAHVKLHDYGSITVAPGKSALLITENARVVKRFVELEALLDKEPASVLSQFVQLQRADAEKVSEMVMKAISDQQKEKAGAAPDAASGAGGSDRLVTGDVRLVPDERTNRILVITRPSSFPLVRSLIEQFDTPASLRQPSLRTLYYISALDVLPALIDVIKENTEKKNPDEEVQKAMQNAQNTGSSSDIPKATAVAPPAYSSSGGSSSGVSRPDQLSDPNERNAPVSATVGRTILVANPQANTILVSGPPESIEKVNEVLDRLDKRPKQVYLACVIGQLALGNSMEFGIDWLVHYSQNANGTGAASSFITSSPFTGAAPSAAATTGSTTTSTSPLPGAINPATLVNPAAFTNLVGGLTIYGVIGDAVTYYVRALENTNRFKVLSRPVVYTANNKRAKIANGQKVPIPATSLSAFTSGTATPSVSSTTEYIDVLLKLEVVPLINANGEITLKIAQTNDNVQGTQNISGNNVPVIGTQELNTTITLKNRQAVVLGGLVSETTKRVRQGLPLLMDIPYAGYLFSNTKVEKDREELMIFIQPIIVDDDKTAAEVTREEERRTMLPPDIQSVNQYKKYDGIIETRKAIPVDNPSMPR